MSHAMTRTILSGVVTFFEHAAAVVIGLVLMVIGLGLGVTMIMLPVGVVVGLAGVLMVVVSAFRPTLRADPSYVLFWRTH
jgi:hypothetical protein